MTQKMMQKSRARRVALAGLAFAGASVGTLTILPLPATAQWSTVYEQTYLPASHNWIFRRNYNAAERLFYAFDYGHAILYETLWTRPDAPVTLLEENIYDRLTRRILVRPPRLPLEESAIEVAYAKLAPEAKVMFDWAHVLHRQVYDVWADERIPVEEKDLHVDEILRYYRSRPDIAFSSQPKSMDIMDGQSYSLAFRERFPKFNGLIWGYHWLQIGLYEPLILGRNSSERQSLIRATVARFWQMLEDPPATMPYLMPMTPAVAPTFAERYPEIAIIFDNLHMMHDVISDILASPDVPRNRKRDEIMRAVELFRDDTSYVTTIDEWRQMSTAMGVHNQGGPAVGFLPELPIPTVPRGMSMAGMDHLEMDHSQMEHDDHAASVQQPHQGHAMPPAPARPDHDGAATPEMHRTLEFIVRLLTDPQIERRIHADARLHELWADPDVQRHLEMMRRMHGPGEDGEGAHQEHQVEMMEGWIKLELVRALLEDPAVRTRIDVDPGLRELWNEADVRQRIQPEGLP